MIKNETRDEINMAGLTHLAVGIAYKKLVPRISVWILIVGAYLIDVLFLGFMVVGIESPPVNGQTGSAPWSHSLFMAIIWSLLTALISYGVWHEQRISLSLGLLVFSHWIIDFISQPMTYIFSDGSMPLLHPFGGAPSFGLGIWSTEMGVLLGEFGMLIIGLTIYLIVWRQLRNGQEIEIKTVLSFQ
ncbi:MAG: metal-dependent hydrolase [Candidatus Heimdallarchaeota archaeon]